jgi:hypothetical protein
MSTQQASWSVDRLSGTDAWNDDEKTKKILVSDLDKSDGDYP